MLITIALTVLCGLFCIFLYFIIVSRKRKGGLAEASHFGVMVAIAAWLVLFWILYLIFRE